MFLLLLYIHIDWEVNMAINREERKKQIILAAAQIFAQKGYTGTVMDEIARCAGIGKGTIYEYFDSKEDLFFAVFEWYMKESGSAATVSISALGETSPSAGITQFS